MNNATLEKEFKTRAEYSSRLNEISQPLFNNTPIHYFSVGRFYYDGSYTGFTSDIEWEKVAESHHLNAIPDVINYYLHQFKQNYDLWSLSSVFSQNKNTEKFFQTCSEFGHCNGMTLVKRFEDCCEVYWFASNGLEGVDQFYLEKQDLLEHFVLYAKDKIMSDKILMDKLYSHNVFPGINQPSQQIKSVDLDGELLFPVQRYYFGKDSQCYFTKREWQCIKLLLQGNDSRQVAANLSVSCRTIETHFKNIKSKMGVKTLDKLRAILWGDCVVQAMLRMGV